MLYGWTGPARTNRITADDIAAMSAEDIDGLPLAASTLVHQVVRPAPNSVWRTRPHKDR